MTGHRPADVGGLDFGSGKPITYRRMWGDEVSPQADLVLIYAPIKSSWNPDEGSTFTITLETELVPKLLEDRECNEHFEHRGVDGVARAGEAGRPRIRWASVAVFVAS